MEEIKFEVDKNYVLKVISCPKIITKEMMEELLKNYVRGVVLPEGVERIDDYAFANFYGIKNITLPSTVKSIGRYAFMNSSLGEVIVVPDSVSVIEEGAFSETRVNKVVLPKSLKVINKNTFSSSSISEINVPSSVIEINEGAFANCNKLKSIVLPSSLRKIGFRVFRQCNGLKIVDMSLCNVENLEDEMFFSCSNLSSVELPYNLKKIGNSVFGACSRLENLHIPDSVEEIGIYSFTASGLSNFNIPVSINKIDRYTFNYCPLEDVSINDNGNIISDSFYKKTLLFNKDNKFFYSDKNIDKYVLYNKGKLIYIDEKELFSKANNINNLHYLKEESYARLWYWTTKKFLVNYSVIENMPFDDIDLFFINNNCEKWRELLKLSNIDNDINRGSLFKLCYVLGVFSDKGSISDRAFEFIKNNIINKMSADDIHSRFDGFDTNNGFDKMYADFFMKYYDDDFMIADDVDLLCASYNNFKNIKKIYPNKIVNTNSINNVLLPEHVISAVYSKPYSNVNKGNLSFSIVVGKYGYSQSEFELLQEWFNEAKNIKEKDIEIFISSDVSTSDDISYELLEKNDPLGAVLGNITNCCQRLNAQGEDCVKYGMCEPNSKFMTFNFDNKIIGQAWVWYDEKRKTVCLDNIEVPSKYRETIKRSSRLSESFYKCLMRMGDNFVNEMERHGLKVNKVTVGRGCNDILDILNKYFEFDSNSKTLSDYVGYTDANMQYIIKKR